MPRPKKKSLEILAPEVMQKDPVAVATELFGATLWKDQIAIMESVRDNPRTAWRSCHGIGKCIYEKDHIILMNGEIALAKELIGKRFQVISFLPDGTQQPAWAIAADNGIKPVFRLTTVQGRTISRTPNHRLYAGKLKHYRGNHVKIEMLGWTEIKHLPKDGALVLVPDKLDCNGQLKISDDEVKLLGYLLGDGGTTAPGTVTFTQKDGITKQEYIDIVKRLGSDVRQCELRYDPYTIRTIGNGKRSIGYPSVYLNPVLDLVRKWGLDGTKSRDKRFPDFVWQLPDRQIALLLNRLFACDGWAYNGKAGKKASRNLRQIGISLASEGMIRDIEKAMLRVGVSGNVRSRTVKYKGEEFLAYEWVARTGMQINAFAEKVGIYGKEDAIKKCVDSINQANSHYTQKWAYKDVPEGYHWEKVKSVEYIGDLPTVTIEVEKTHTFLTTFVEHNTYIVARLVLWFLFAFPYSIVLTTAPTWRQVEKLVWKEIRSCYSRAKMPLGGTLAPKATELSIVGDEWVAMGLSTNDPDRFQGYHAEHLLVVVDEGAGVLDDIYEAIEGVLTSAHCREVLIGNPTNIGGQFYRAFREPGWKTGHTSAWDTPNFTKLGITREDIANDTWQAKVPIKANGDFDWPAPYLITPAWVADKYERWRPNHPAYSARVEGEFPEQGERNVIPLGWIEAAQERYESTIAEGSTVLGVDVARYGQDLSVIALRQGSKVISLKVFSGKDTQEIAGEALKASRETKAEHIKVDVIGLGAGVVDSLRAARAPVMAVNVAEASDEKDDSGNKVYANRRAELWWTLREALNPKNSDPLALPPDDELLGDLAAPAYKINAKGAIQIEDKDETKKRLGRSPDRGDAVILTFAHSDDDDRIVCGPGSVTKSSVWRS